MLREWKTKRVVPLPGKSEAESFHMEEQVRVVLAGYCEELGRIRTLELLEELRQEVLSTPLRPELDWETPNQYVDWRKGGSDK